MFSNKVATSAIVSVLWKRKGKSKNNNTITATTTTTTITLLLLSIYGRDRYIDERYIRLRLAEL